jgi:integrase
LKSRCAAAPEEFLFPADKAGEPLKKLDRAWGRICTAAQISNARVHDLRHTFASLLVNDGVSLPLIGKLLGHTRPSTTDRYAHIDDAATRAATERLGSLLPMIKKNEP